jgi:hypothetical protein
VLILGASGFIGKAITEALIKDGVNVVATKYKSASELVESPKVSVVYFNIGFLEDIERLEKILKGVSVVVDCTKASIEERLDVQSLIYGLIPEVKYFLVSKPKEFDGKELKQATTIIESAPVIGRESKLYKDLVEVTDQKLCLMPINPLTTCSPIHIKDFANIVSSLLEDNLITKTSHKKLMVKGSQKITLKYLLEIIGEKEGTKPLFVFWLGAKLSNLANKGIREGLDFGMDFETWAALRDSYSDESDGIDLAGLQKLTSLSVKARI